MCRILETVTVRNLTLRYSLEEGTFSLEREGFFRISGACCGFRDRSGAFITSRDLKKRRITENKEEQGAAAFGVECSGESGVVLRQHFRLGDGGCMTWMEAADAHGEVSTNRMVPILADGGENLDLYGSDLKVLFAPFDNDKWVRFAAYPLQYAVESYEFTAVFDERELCGLVVGSVTHDTWKTGIRVGGKGRRLSSFEVRAGVSGEQTRDALPHGTVSGRTVRSPKIFLGWFESYRTGLERYGELIARETPAPVWKGGVPFGWNSWAALMHTLDDGKYMAASDFIRDKVRAFPENNVYINFDAGWNRIEPEKLKAAVRHVVDNGQKPGAYLAPFITGKCEPGEEAEGTGGYPYRDILLKDFEGNVLPPVDGLYSLDPTHPGTLAKIRNSVREVVSLGFTYVKADFLGHAAREGCFYDRSVTTGIQAYNFGMKFFTGELSPEKTGRDIFLSLSIAPILPNGYGHARRISCDAFGTIDQSEYMLNSLTYLWWMNDRLYRFNDPDHIVLYRTYDKVSSTPEEARTRLNAAAICGTVVLDSDDFSREEARKRAEELFNNEEICRLAACGETFVPLSGNSGDRAACSFVKKSGDGLYLAVFNFSPCSERTLSFSARELGLGEGKVYAARDLWSKKTERFVSALSVPLPPAGSTIFEIRET